MLSDWLARADWQTGATLLTVVLALVWLARRIQRTIKKALHASQGQVSGCGHCPRNPAAGKAKDVVPLESISTRRSAKTE